MKVAYIAPYKDGTGYSKSAIEYILSLDTIGVDVVPRQAKMTQTNGEVPDRIKELEQNDLSNIDAVIQHNLPSEFQYKSGIQNIGAFCYETSTLTYTNWLEKLSLMDKLIVPCVFQQEVLESHNLKSHVVPFSVDVEKYKKEYKTYDFGLPKDCLKFYTISENVTRKNIHTLIMAYSVAFTSSENVALIIKTHMPNRNSQECLKHMTDLVGEVRKRLGRFSSSQLYPKIVLITDYLTDDQICSIHASCDWFVIASRGESFCLPAVDAIGFNKNSITPENTVFLDHMKEFKKSFSARCCKQPVFNSAIGNLYTGNEEWFQLNISDMVEEMKFAYRYRNEETGDLSSIMTEKLSRKNIGLKLKGVLDAG